MTSPYRKHATMAGIDFEGLAATWAFDPDPDTLVLFLREVVALALEHEAAMHDACCSCGSPCPALENIARQYRAGVEPIMVKEYGL